MRNESPERYLEGVTNVAIIVSSVGKEPLETDDSIISPLIEAFDPVFATILGEKKQSPAEGERDFVSHNILFPRRDTSINFPDRSRF